MMSTFEYKWPLEILGVFVFYSEAATSSQVTSMDIRVIPIMP